jgi:hypothetical protein
MCQFRILLLIVICVVFALGFVSAIVPNWMCESGLDFWSYSSEADHLREIKEEGRYLDQEIEVSEQRIEMKNRIALSLCKGQITLDEAIATIATIVHASPQWFDRLRHSYIAVRIIDAKSSEREIMICYLLLGISNLLLEEETVGQSASDSSDSQAASLRKRLAQLNEEVRAQAPSLLRRDLLLANSKHVE